MPRGVCKGWDCTPSFPVLLGTPALQEDGAGRISLAATPQGVPGVAGWGAHTAGPQRCQAPGQGQDPAALLVTHGRARLPFIMGKNLPKRLIKD